MTERIAEFVVASAKYVVAVPHGIDPLDAAPLTCAGVTTYKAVKVAKVGPSDVVAVFGVGGLGHMAVQYARIAGATVVAIDIHEDKLDMARKLGATHTINAAIDDPGVVLRELGGADAAIVTAVIPGPFEQAFAGHAPWRAAGDGRSPRREQHHLPIFQTVLNGISVIGSIVGTRLDLAEVFELHAAGKTQVVRTTRTIDEVNEAMKAVEAGDIDARVVFDFRVPATT